MESAKKREEWEAPTPVRINEIFVLLALSSRYTIFKVMV